MSKFSSETPFSSNWQTGNSQVYKRWEMKHCLHIFQLVLKFWSMCVGRSCRQLFKPFDDNCLFSAEGTVASAFLVPRPGLNERSGWKRLYGIWTLCRPLCCRRLRRLQRGLPAAVRHATILLPVQLSARPPSASTGCKCWHFRPPCCSHFVFLSKAKTTTTKSNISFSDFFLSVYIYIYITSFLTFCAVKLK